MTRARLSERALPRLHFAEGRCHVVLHDGETGECSAITPAEWVLLAAADGTRDADGLLLAAKREGVEASRAALDRLLASVEGAGLLEDGPLLRLRAKRNDAAADDAADDAATRPVRAMPGYAFTCDRGGRCCRTYSSIVFSPREAAVARSVRPDVLDVGDRHEHAFTFERGTGPVAGSAVALVNGGCAFLEGSLCGLHTAAGPTSKPIGCNLFPLSLVDDGTHVRAAVTVECACVLSSADANEAGEPLVEARTRADLDPRMAVETLPSTVEVTSTTTVPLAAFVAWSDAALDALDPHGTDGAADAPTRAWSLATAAERGGCADPEEARAALAAPPSIDVDAALLRVSALGARAARLAAQNAFRSERDLVRRGLVTVAAAAQLLQDRDVLEAVTTAAPSATVARDEAFYLRAVLFGHQLVGPPIAEGLRDRGVAMWIARALPLAASVLGIEDEPGFDRPLAIVEALLRAYGLRLYVRALG